MPTNPASSSFPAWLPADERKADRLRLSLPAQMSSDRFDTINVRLTDLTGLGCRLSTAERVSMGVFVTVHIPGFTQISGWVAWSEDGELGLDFANPLPDPVTGFIVQLSTDDPDR